MAENPNIVYIMADDMGYGDPGCYGATKIRTPNMDRLAAEGVRFLDAHSSSAVCTPSRYSVLTGRYCWRASLKRGVNGGFSLPLIDPARETIATLLKRHGYATAAVGKWHVGWEWQAKHGEKINYNCWEDEGHVDYSRPIIGGPTDVGFDYFFGIAGSLDMPPYCFVENDRVVAEPTEEKHPYNPQQRHGFMSPGWRDEDVDVHHARKACEWLERTHQAEADKPFFLYLTPSAPHRPCMPPDFLAGVSDAGPRGDLVATVDWVVGQVIGTLEKIGRLDDTLIIVTSDNGARPTDVDGETYGHKSCGDLRGYKGQIWDGGHREPFIARWPGRIEPGGTCDELICLSDMFATFAAIVGERLPDNAAEDSFSFLPALLGDDRGRPVREAVVHHSVDGMFSIRDSRWKLIDGRGAGAKMNTEWTRPQEDDMPGQLYEMSGDWRETTNLWDRETEVRDRLLRLLQTCKDENRSRPRHEQL
ncbi:MAG: sulfatase family protein [Phycisphaerae bacterium]